MRFNAFEPGFNPSTGLGRETSIFLRLFLKYVLPLLAPFMKYWSKPEARLVTKILINQSCQTGLYYRGTRDPTEVHGSRRRRQVTSLKGRI